MDNPLLAVAYKRSKVSRENGVTVCAEEAHNVDIIHNVLPAGIHILGGVAVNLDDYACELLKGVVLNPASGVSGG